MNWILLLAYSAVPLVSGYQLPRIRKKRNARIIGWTIALATVWVPIILTQGESPLIRMITITFLQLLSMKNLVMIETYSIKPGLNPVQWISFATGWFGMRPSLFESLPSTPLPYRQFIIKGLSRITVGIVLIFLSHLVDSISGGVNFFFPQLLLLAGLSFILHFGILNLSTGLWRSRGIGVDELFRSPYKAKSLREFWGKRWNLAFSEMTALIAYRPLRSIVDPNVALIAAFMLSGLLHEIAISFPVNTGYGLPMTYFGIQAVLLQIETRITLVHRILSHRLWSRIWVFFWLITPMPLLFHPAFINEVLVPVRELIVSALHLP